MAKYMNLNREEIKKRVDELIAQYAAHGIELHLDEEDIYDKRQNEMWYGGEIASFEYKDRYTVYIEVVGDVGADLYDEDGEYAASVKDRHNGGHFYDDMCDYIPDDETLECYLDLSGEEEVKVRLVISDFNWIEVQVYDNKDEAWIDSANVLENSESVLDIDYEDVMELVGRFMEEYENM